MNLGEFRGREIAGRIKKYRLCNLCVAAGDPCQKNILDTDKEKKESLTRISRINTDKELKKILGLSIKLKCDDPV